ncbi:MAG: DUF1217 domain-containing protein [Pseudomonadota bacterium]
MTFEPILPTSGVLGFRLLEQTEATQRAIYDRRPEIARDTAYFRENIANVSTAAELVADRRLLRVALGAFGMDDQLNKGAFMRRILEEGTESSTAFATRFVDPRFTRIAEAFGFGNLIGSQTARPGFADEITAAYTERQFEIAVGEQDDSLRLALNFRREIERYATASDPNGNAWFSAMGDVPVRTVFEGAFGLPSSFGQIDIDLQRDTLRDLNQKYFDDTSLAVFQDPTKVNQIIERFLLRETLNNGPSPTTPGFAALTLLGVSSGGVGPVSLQNIVLSNFRPSL